MIKTGDNRDMRKLGNIGAIAMLGDIFHAGDQKAQNDWKARMLKAGLGETIQMPEDWDTLSEADKESRLNGAINALN